MLNKGFELVARRRGVFLAGVLVVAVAMGIAARSMHDLRWLALSGTTLGLAFGFLALAFVAGSRYHPAVLVPFPGEQAFATASNPAPVLSAAAYTFLPVGITSDNIGDLIAGDGEWLFNLVMSGMLLLLLTASWVLVWNGSGLRLRPDGLHDRQPLGSLFIPWEAVAAAVPLTRTQLTMYYHQPELVRRRGLRPFAHKLPSGSDADYLARVIHEYLTHADRRPAIGSTAELTRLSAAVG